MTAPITAMTAPITADNDVGYIINPDLRSTPDAEMMGSALVGQAIYRRLQDAYPHNSGYLSEFFRNVEPLAQIWILYRVGEDKECVNTDGYTGLPDAQLSELYTLLLISLIDSGTVVRHVETPIVARVHTNEDGNQYFTLDAMEEFNNNNDREEDYFNNDGYIETHADDTPAQDTDSTYVPAQDTDSTYEDIDSPGDSAYSKDSTGSDTTEIDTETTVYTNSEGTKTTGNTETTIYTDSEGTETTIYTDSEGTKTTGNTETTKTTTDTDESDDPATDTDESDDPSIHSHGTDDTPLWLKVDPNAVLGKNPLDSDTDDEPTDTDGSPMVVDEVAEIISCAKHIHVSTFKEHDPNMRMEPSDSDDSD
jgi:hypothetical protein